MANGQIDFLQIDRSAIGKNIDPKLHKRCIEQKLSFIEKPNLPIYDKIRQYMQDVQNLSFTEDPNYNKLKGYLAEVTNVLARSAMEKRRQLEEKMTEMLFKGPLYDRIRATTV